MAHLHNIFEEYSYRLNVAIFINIVLTLVQVIGGILSGSLSLIADALHNFSDAGALFVAVIARKIGNKPADNHLSYGYKRAEILGALINSTTLIIVGAYLCYEAVARYFNPEPIDGWIVVWVAVVALLVDLATAFLTYISGGKDNLNIRFYVVADGGHTTRHDHDLEFVRKSDGETFDIVDLLHLRRFIATLLKKLFVKIETEKTARFLFWGGNLIVKNFEVLEELAQVPHKKYVPTKVSSRGADRP